MAACGGDGPPPDADGEILEIEVTTPAQVVVSMESGLVGAVADMAVDAGGRVYVLDPLDHAVKVFDAEVGDWLVATMGGQGEGPGELARPTALALMDDSLVVGDAGNRRLQAFDLEGRPLGTRPLPGAYTGALARDGTLVRPTLGMDSVLAVIHDPDGAERTRIGQVLAPPASVVNLGEMRREIAEGQVPAIFLNTAEAVLGGGDDVWLIVSAAGLVERYDLMGGNRLVSVTLDEPEFQGARERLLERNRHTEANQIFGLRYFAAARVVGDRLWLLLDTGPAGPATVVVVSPQGHVVERRRFPGVRGAGNLAVDPAGDWAVFVLSDRAELLRVPAGPSPPG